MEVRGNISPKERGKHHEIDTSSGNYNFERCGYWDTVGPGGERV